MRLTPNPLYPALAGLLLLTACDNVAGVNGREYLDLAASKKGPEVAGMAETLAKSAQEAEDIGDFSRAAQIYQQVSDANPNEARYRESLAECLRRSGQYDKAIVNYDALLAANAQSAAAMEGKGLALMARGSTDDASKVLADAMKIDPKRWRTLNAIGVLFAAKKMPDEAKQYFSEALRLSNQNPAVLNNLGLTYAFERDYPSAIATLKNAAANAATARGERKFVMMNLALVYGAAGKVTEARTTAATYLSGPALDNNTGFYAHLAKDDQLAKTYFQMALTGSKTYYDKAWGNLEYLRGNANATAPAAPQSNASPGGLPSLALVETPAAIAVPRPAAQNFASGNGIPFQVKKDEWRQPPLKSRQAAAPVKEVEAVDLTPPPGVEASPSNSGHISAPVKIIGEADDSSTQPPRLQPAEAEKTAEKAPEKEVREADSLSSLMRGLLTK